MSITKVTFIGLGVMGYPMAGHLKRNNYEVTVFNRTSEKSDNWVKDYNGLSESTPGKASQNSEVIFTCVGRDDDLRDVMEGDNGILNNVKDNLVDLISKMGEKITLRRCEFFSSDKYVNFSYMHSSYKKNLGKIGVLLSLETSQKKEELLEIGKQLSMHIAASSPLAIDMQDLDKNLIQKEKEIITEELKNSGKDNKIIEKISAGKLNKFIAENTFLNQEWIMEPKKKVRNILKDITGKKEVKIIKFARFKVGEEI